MKRLIRKSVWETNSSSSHSIALGGEDKQFVLETIYPDQNGVITLTGGEFGWEWFKHNDAITKANYAAVDFDGSENKIEMLFEVIKEQTGATEIVLKLDDSYIDHQSRGNTPDNRRELRDFIFNKNSYLFGGNDNSEASPIFYDVPEIRDNVMILPKYKVELIINGLDETMFFRDDPTDEEIEHGISSLLNDRFMYDNGSFIDKSESSSISFQINGHRDKYFTLSYHMPRNEASSIILVKEMSIIVIDNQLRNSGQYEGKQWNEQRDILVNEVLKNENLFRKVGYTLKQI